MKITDAKLRKWEADWQAWNAQVKANPEDLSLLLKEPVRPRWSAVWNARAKQLGI